MNVIKSGLALIGVLTLAMNAVADIQNVVKLSQYVAFLVNNWTEIVHAVWREICNLLGLPVIDILATPFSFLLAGVALAISAALGLCAENRKLVADLMADVDAEAAKSTPVARHAAERMHLKLRRSTRLSVYDPDKKRILPNRVGESAQLVAPLAWIGLITALYAATDVSPLLGGDGADYVIAPFAFLAQWAFLYMLPFAACVGLAGYLGRRLEDLSRASEQADWLLRFRQDQPVLARDLDAFVVTFDDANQITQTEDTQDITPLLSGLSTTVPASHAERRVVEIMSARALAAVLLVLAIYVFSYVIIILETVGLF